MKNLLTTDRNTPRMGGPERGLMREVASHVTRLQEGRIRTEKLDAGEEAELYALTHEVRVTTLTGNRSTGTLERTVTTTLEHLDKKQRRRYLELVEKAFGDPGYFERIKKAEEEAQRQAEQAEAARIAKLRKRMKTAQPGSVTLPREVFDHLRPNFGDGGGLVAMEFMDLAVLTFILLQLENDVCLMRGRDGSGRIENDALIWNRFQTSGIPQELNPDGRISGPQLNASLEQLARNQWLTVEGGLGEVRVSRGKRLLRRQRDAENAELAKAGQR